MLDPQLVVLFGEVLEIGITRHGLQERKVLQGYLSVVPSVMLTAPLLPTYMDSSPSWHASLWAQSQWNLSKGLNSETMNQKTSFSLELFL